MHLFTSCNKTLENNEKCVNNNFEIGTQKSFYNKIKIGIAQKLFFITRIAINYGVLPNVDKTEMNWNGLGMECHTMLGYIQGQIWSNYWDRVLSNVILKLFEWKIYLVQT